MLFAHVKCDSSVWQGSTPCPARGFLIISGLVAHSSTCPSAVGEPAQSPVSPSSPRQWPPCSGMDYAELVVPVGHRLLIL